MGARFDDKMVSVAASFGSSKTQICARTTFEYLLTAANAFVATEVEYDKLAAAPANAAVSLFTQLAYSGVEAPRSAPQAPLAALVTFPVKWLVLLRFVLSLGAGVWINAAVTFMLVQAL